MLCCCLLFLWKNHLHNSQWQHYVHFATGMLKYGGFKVGEDARIFLFTSISATNCSSPHHPLSRRFRVAPSVPLSIEDGSERRKASGEWMKYAGGDVELSDWYRIKPFNSDTWVSDSPLFSAGFIPVESSISTQGNISCLHCLHRLPINHCHAGQQAVIETDSLS